MSRPSDVQRSPLSHVRSERESADARCPQCFSREFALVDRFADPDPQTQWKIVRCSECGQMFTNPRPPTMDWETDYPPEYLPHQARLKPTGWSRALRAWGERRLLEWYRGYGQAASMPVHVLRTLLAPALNRWLDPYIVPPHGDRTLLDFGCGAGAYLGQMKSLGWDVVGIDRSPQVVEVVRQAYGVSVITGTLPCAELPRAEFDVITAWQVLEHVDRPRQALAGIRDLLRPKGRLVLTVPNQAGWAACHFGPHWIGLDLPRHLIHFTPTLLAAMLQAEGFRIVHRTTIGHASWIRHSARKRQEAKPEWRNRFHMSRMGSRWASQAAVKSGIGESIYVVAELA